MAKSDTSTVVHPTVVMKKIAQIAGYFLHHSASKTSYSSSTAGFTLVELLVSISILSILAALSLPQLNGIYERQKLDAS